MITLWCGNDERPTIVVVKSSLNMHYGPTIPDAACGMSLPAREAARLVVVAASDPNYEESPSTGYHVLFVDDDDLVRETLGELLRLEGFTITEAVGATEALDLLKRDDSVQFLLSDLSMPGMDGLALIEAAQAIRPELPSALLTGFALPASGRLPASLSVFRKPASPAAIAKHIERAISGR